MNHLALPFVYELIQMDRVWFRNYEASSEQDISGKTDPRPGRGIRRYLPKESSVEIPYSDLETSNFSQGQGNQGIARRHTLSMSHK